MGHHVVPCAAGDEDGDGSDGGEMTSHWSLGMLCSGSLRWTLDLKKGKTKSICLHILMQHLFFLKTFAIRTS